MAEDREWDLAEKHVTELKAISRRRLLTRLGVYGGIAAVGGGAWYLYRGTDSAVLAAGRGEQNLPPYSFESSKDPAFSGVDQKLTDKVAVARHVNFYEFNPFKEGTWRQAAALPIRPWALTIGGLVQKPTTIAIDDLDRLFGKEQRVYRHRCVETWAMVVPWVGFPLRKLIDYVQPLAKAKYVQFRSARIEDLTHIPSPGGFPWPYTEALTIAEAANELAFLATGAYGERLLKQNGAPVRLVVPWKYGFKSAKSLVSVEFTDQRPPTFWNATQPREYGFHANVDPQVDHPRWSQKTEWMIDTRERRPTRRYNGYEKWVAHLYTGDEV